MRRYFFFLLALSMTYGCKKDDPVTPDRGRTFLHIVNGVEADSFNVTFDYFNADDVVIDGFFWKRNFPIAGYADMEEGGNPDEFGNGKLYLTVSRKPFANEPADTLMQPKEILLAKDEFATLCLADSFGQVIALKFDDAYNVPGDTSILVRFINLASGMATADLSTTDGALNISNVAFMGESGFTTMPFGAHVFETADTSGNTVNSQNIYLPGGKAYTFYLSGNSLHLDFYRH